LENNKEGGFDEEFGEGFGFWDDGVSKGSGYLCAIRIFNHLAGIF